MWSKYLYSLCYLAIVSHVLQTGATASSLKKIIPRRQIVQTLKEVIFSATPTPDSNLYVNLNNNPANRRPSTIEKIKVILVNYKKRKEENRIPVDYSNSAEMRENNNTNVGIGNRARQSSSPEAKQRAVQTATRLQNTVCYLVNFG